MPFFSKKVTHTYNMTDEAVQNPLMGFAPQAQNESLAKDQPLVYIDITFRELEPQKGEYAFSQIAEENQIERWKSEGKHAVLRFICDYPRAEAHLDIPDWLYEMTGDGTKYDSSYGKGYSPDYNNIDFIAAHTDAIRALGNYFGKDTFISYIELGSLGHWGEWHVKYDDGLVRIPKKAVRVKYIEPYLKAFPNAKLLMRRSFAEAKQFGLGLYNDMAGDKNSTDEWISWIKKGGDFSQAEEENALVPMKTAWQSAPVGGEFTSSLAMDWMLKVNTEMTADLIAASHTTFLGPKVPVPSKNAKTDLLYQQGVDTVMNHMGYRLGIRRSEITKHVLRDTYRVRLTFTNKGVAPMYWDWPVYLYVLDASDHVVEKTLVSLRLTTLLPDVDIKVDTEMRLTNDTWAGKKLCIGIEDPMTGETAVTLVSDEVKIGKMSVVHTFDAGK